MAFRTEGQVGHSITFSFSGLQKRVVVLGLLLGVKVDKGCYSPAFGCSSWLKYTKNKVLILAQWTAKFSVCNHINNNWRLQSWWKPKNCNQYSHHRYYDLLQSKFNELNLIQLIKFNTWSRLVGTVWKESCLDHLIYISTM